MEYLIILMLYRLEMRSFDNFFYFKIAREFSSYRGVFHLRLIKLFFQGNTILHDVNYLDEKVDANNRLGKITEFYITTPTEFLALLHLIKTTIFDNTILIVFHSLSSLLSSEKVHSSLLT